MTDELLSIVETALADSMGPSVVRIATVPIQECVARLREENSFMVLVLADADLPSLDRAMLLAAIGPLAVARAPAGRIGALDIAPSASHEAIAAAAQFLVGATSTTGQILRIA